MWEKMTISSCAACHCFAMGCKQKKYDKQLVVPMCFYKCEAMTMKSIAPPHHSPMWLCKSERMTMNNGAANHYRFFLCYYK
jgi:hypothetical protein